METLREAIIEYRMADVFITGHDFDTLLKSMDGKTRLLQIGLPKDAEWVATYFDHVRQTFRIRYRHQSFARVCNGEEIPILQMCLINMLDADLPEVITT
mgnify:CR=1 FL=1